MTTTQHSMRIERVLSILLGLLLVLPAHAWAQDNDDGGVLPGSSSTSSSGGSQQGDGAGGSGAAGVSVDSSIAISGEPGALETSAVQATLRLACTQGATAAQFGAGSEEADFEGQVPGFSVELGAAEIAIQGEGLLRLRAGVSARLQAPASSEQHVAVLVFDLGEQPLAQVLAGHTQPLLTHVLGAVQSIDLQVFEAIVTKYADQLPGIHVSIALVSRDAPGALHYSAVRCATAGGPLEVLTAE